jgi:hypothetical protein
VIQDTSNPNATAIPLALDNILWADWVPDSLSLIVYSTAEPRSGFPGWQANNDLWIAQIGETGEIIREQQLLEASGGGIYGWYGTFFNFAPDGRTLVWRQPDAVGLLQEIFPAATDEATPTPTVSASLVEELEEHRLFLLEGFSRTPEIQFAPRNAYDFVWIPDASWSPDGEFVVTTTHGPPLGAESAEDSPVYNLTIFPRDGAYQIELISNVGMWALPAFSPIPDPVTGDIRLAYLQAEDPLNSVVSSYRLIIRDIDGSNARTLFPEEDDLGLTANLFAWSPDGLQIAVTYQGNIYIIDTLNGLAQQVTGDGQSSIPRWVP